MFKKEIETFFKTKEYTIKKFDKGLTNHNYLLDVEGNTYVVRVPLEDSEHIINRKQEKVVQQLCTSLDVDTIYFNEDSGVKITKYVPHLYEYEECPYEDKIERCARLMKHLHSIESVPFSFHPFETLINYKKHVAKPLYDIARFEQEAQRIKTFDHKEVLCHNDWVSGNILFGEIRDYLIDYEYGASNDPMFDVTSFLSENQIFDETLRERFYKEYFGTLDEETREKLRLWEVFQNVLWCYWAMMMYESRNEDIYAQIAKDKYNALCKNEIGG